MHRAGGELVHEKGDEKDEEKTEFQLTDSITSSTIGTPASLRSENDQLHLGTSDWDPIGISNHLHRNKQEHHMAGHHEVPRKTLSLGSYLRSDGQRFEIKALIYELPKGQDSWLVVYDAHHEEWGHSRFTQIGRAHV